MTIKLKKIGKAKNLIKSNIEIFRCPICKCELLVDEKYSLFCEKKHCFDISKKGYVNLINTYKKTIYDNELFESRNKVYNAGIYNNLVDELVDLISKYTKEINRPYILDTGCGEGFYLNKLHDMLGDNYNLAGIDISKEGISFATRCENDIMWSISDLANLPFGDNKLDIILNILSPANYNEFSRTLKDKGIIIKVVPESEYLKEIRENLKNKIKRDTYSNTDIVEVFKEKLNVIEERVIKYTQKLDKDILGNLIDMTPLTSALNEDKVLELKNSNISKITINLRILVGVSK